MENLNDFDRELARRIDRENVWFALEAMPQSFSKPTGEEIMITRLGLQNRAIPRLAEHYNASLDLEISCHLIDLSVAIDDIISYVYTILMGIAFRSRLQIRKLTVGIMDVTKDPLNDGEPFIGIVLRKTWQVNAAKGVWTQTRD
jgi:hypothetical protein